MNHVCDHAFSHGGMVINMVHGARGPGEVFTERRVELTPPAGSPFFLLDRAASVAIHSLIAQVL